jgi:hypothetical protein
MVRLSLVWLGAVFVSLVAGVLQGQPRAEQVECSGTVVDPRGRPVPEAQVVGYEQLYEYAEGRIGWATPSHATTDTNGRFHMRVSAERRDYIWVVAWKKGLSLGWQWLRNAEDGMDLTIRLGEPTVLAGTVMDENGEGIAGAMVRPSLKMDWMGGSVGVSFHEPRAWFTTRTDDRGRFRFDYIPAGATADFWVEAPGRASCWTYWSGGWSNLEGSQFKAGQTDIRVVLKPEAVIRGRVIDEESGAGVAGVCLLARPNVVHANYSCVAPVTSGADGVFVYRGLAADDYSLQVAAPQDRTADWVGKDVKVTTQAGQTIEVDVPVGRGGIIEVTVENAATGKPLANAQANVSLPANFGLHPCWYHSAYTNTEGLVRLRVPAGECRLNTWAPAYQGLVDPERVVIAKGETLRRKARLEAYPSVTGIVRDPNGQPAAGVVVSSKPICEGAVRTDRQGQFKVTWYPQPSIRAVLVLAQDPVRELAGLAEVKDQTRPLEVTLAPAFTVRGRLTDPNGAPVARAKVVLQAFMPGWITSAGPSVLTDANGVYAVRALPTPCENFKYALEVQPQRHGPTRLRTLSFDAAQNRLVEVPPIVLPPADRSISGVVVDANGVPAPGVPVFISGPRGSDTAGQPSRRTVTDAQGRFAVDGVCAGPLRIQAAFGSATGGAGFLDAQGGDRDVKVVLGRESAHEEWKPLLDKPLPDGKDLIDLKPEQTQGKRMLLCFADLSQRPSRHCVDVLAKQAEMLKQKDLIVAVIQVGAPDEAAKTWIKERAGAFLLGQTKADAEKVKSMWAVRSLPWLILADEAHVVRAEGFSVSEIDEALKKCKEGKQ